MKVVYEMQPLVRMVLQEKDPEPDVVYRQTYFILKQETDQGLAIYNTMTKELLLLEGEERNALDEIHPVSETAKQLVHKYFLVPQDHDDCKLADEIRDFFIAVHDKQNNGKLHGYTILPTTDCNARCRYCYEMGCKRIHMTDRIAHDVAAYIIRTCDDNHASLHWFGGEPLFNTRAIDIICDDLASAGVEFRAHMTTNASLFTPEMIEKAKSKWHLNKIQVTLDGTESKYNTIKNYRYNFDESPFRRVLRNIQLVHDSKIIVSVRLNLDEENLDDLKQLVIQLKCFMAEQPGYNIYSHLLFDITKSTDALYRGKMTELNEELMSFINREGCVPEYILRREVECFSCQANEGKCIVIDSEGKLYPCEHFNEIESVGTVWDDPFVITHQQAWRKRQNKIAACDRCTGYPTCQRIEKCPCISPFCVPEEQRTVIEELQRQLSRDLKLSGIVF